VQLLGQRTSAFLLMQELAPPSRGARSSGACGWRCWQRGMRCDRLLVGEGQRKQRHDEEEEEEGEELYLRRESKDMTRHARLTQLVTQLSPAINHTAFTMSTRTPV